MEDVDGAKAIIAGVRTEANDDDEKDFPAWLERIVKIKPALADAARELL